MKTWVKNGIRFTNPLNFDGNLIFNPSDRQLLAAGYILVQPVKQNGNMKFTKLQIRRTLRTMNQESILDSALSADELARKDWNDAQEIDLSDAVFVKALADQGITEKQLRQIIIQIRRNQ